MHRTSILLLLCAVELLHCNVIHAQTCSQMPGNDIGAKINAKIAATSEGIVDCTAGFNATETLTTPVVVGRAGRAINLKLNRGTHIIANTGAQPAFSIPESADGSSIEGLTLDGSQATQIGVALHGAWYAQLRDSWIYGFSSAGIRVSDELRGTYMWSLTNVVAGDADTPAGRNNINLLIENTGPRGVTFGIMNNFWSTYAASDGIVIKAASRGQAVGTMFNGGGSSYNHGNGLVMQCGEGGGLDINIQSFDMEFNAGDAIVDDPNVFAVNGRNVFFSNNGNGGRNYVPHARGVYLNTSGQDFIFSSSGQDQPTKHVATISGPNQYKGGVEQSTPPIMFRLQGVGDTAVEGVKSSFDQRLIRFRNTETNQWMAWDATLNRLIFDNRQFWNPGTTGTIRFPDQDTKLVGNDTPDSLTNKVIVNPSFAAATVGSASLGNPAGFVLVVVNGQTVRIPYYR